MTEWKVSAAKEATHKVCTQTKGLKKKTEKMLLGDKNYNRARSNLRMHAATTWTVEFADDLLTKPFSVPGYLMCCCQPTYKNLVNLGYSRPCCQTILGAICKVQIF